MKAIFDTRPGTDYDDDISRRYHFPDRYLAQAKSAVGDWIAYREPRRAGGRSGYVAVARLAAVSRDPRLPQHSYAHLEDYLPFDAVVPLRRPEGGHYEMALDAVRSPSLIGSSLQGRSIRTISDQEFGAIARAGLRETLSPQEAVRLGLGADMADPETAELLRLPKEKQERRIVSMLVNRRIRDAAFRRAVCDAYDNTCAVTGLRIVNGGGRSETQAAHIWPVAAGGLDVVQNGIALSSTIHWLFDRHLISLTPELGLLISHNKVPAELRSLFPRQEERIRLPSDRRLWPHPDYVRRHQEAFGSK